MTTVTAKPDLFQTRPHPIPSIGAPPRMLLWGTVSLLLTLTVLVLYVLYLVQVPILVFYVMTHPLPVKTPVVEPGGSVTYLLNYCKFIDTPASVIRELYAVDGTRAVGLADAGWGLRPGCHQIERIEPIPSFVPDGEYVMRLTRQYRKGTYYDEPAVLETQPFRVRHPKGDQRVETDR